MCGISGWLSVAPLADDVNNRHQLELMNDALRHRGPDGDGIWIGQHAAFAHTRLAIIALEEGSQPLQSADGRYSITFNGEIYNYKELKGWLEARGRRFATDSDTEVILQLYQESGWQGFARLRGMYAFAIWDGERQQALLVRDPLGIKPLFIRHQGSAELWFSSEAKAFMATGFQARLNEPALHLLLNYRYIPGSGSLLQGVRQLHPGEVIIWSRQGSIGSYKIEVPAQEEVHLDPLEALSESIEAHTVADVPVGAYLSGGIDSAAVVALMQRVQAQTQTFTLSVGDDPLEAKNARRSAQILGVPNQCGAIDSPPEQTLAHLIWHLEIPKVNSWQVAKLARHASKSVKVVLSGLGGDELFYGYNMHSILASGDRLHRWLPRGLSKPLGGGLATVARELSKEPWSELERASQMLGSLGDWPHFYALLRNVWDSPTLRRAIYGPRMLDQPLADAAVFAREQWSENPDPVAAASLFEWKNKMVNDLLWQEDRMSMAAGLEVRVPFVDSRLAAVIQGISRQELMPGGRKKGYLQQILASILPTEITSRPKSGFQVDAPSFFHQYLVGAAQQWLSRELIVKEGLFNPLFVERVLAMPPRKRLRWHYFILYLMITTHIWLALFEQQQRSF